MSALKKNSGPPARKRGAAGESRGKQPTAAEEWFADKGYADRTVPGRRSIPLSSAREGPQTRRVQVDPERLRILREGEDAAPLCDMFPLLLVRTADGAHQLVAGMTRLRALHLARGKGGKLRPAEYRVFRSEADVQAYAAETGWDASRSWPAYREILERLSGVKACCGSETEIEKRIDAVWDFARRRMLDSE